MMFPAATNALKWFHILKIRDKHLKYKTIFSLLFQNPHRENMNECINISNKWLQLYENKMLYL